MTQVLLRVLKELGPSQELSDVTCGPQEPLLVPPVSPKCTEEPASLPSFYQNSAASGSEEHVYLSPTDTGPQGPPLLLIGPPGSGKSGLLFLAAVLAAEEGTGPVIFLSRDPLQRLPGGGRATRDPLTLKQIRFLYPSSLKELLRLFSSLHLTCSSLSLILLDGVERYLLPSCSPHDGALLSALLIDSASHFNCGLLVSSGPPSEGSEGAFSIMERYFPNQCQLNSENAMEGCFRVSFLPHLPKWILQTEPDGTLRICPLPPNEQRPDEETGLTTSLHYLTYPVIEDMNKR